VSDGSSDDQAGLGGGLVGGAAAVGSMSSDQVRGGGFKPSVVHRTRGAVMMSAHSIAWRAPVPTIRQRVSASIALPTPSAVSFWVPSTGDVPKRQS
jgi:hypothetical protein